MLFHSYLYLSTAARQQIKQSPAFAAWCVAADCRIVPQALVDLLYSVTGYVRQPTMDAHFATFLRNVRRIKMQGSTDKTLKANVKEVHRKWLYSGS
jgi:hypothetical protein